MRKERAYTLTVDLLNAYKVAAIENATSLLMEAQLLQWHSHFARAYFLAVSSIEETGKAMLAFGATGRNLCNPGLQQHVKAILEDHSHKINAAFQAWLLVSPKNETSVKAVLGYVSALQIGREKSMYIDVRHDETLSIPSSLVDRTRCDGAIALATNCLHHTSEYLAKSIPQASSTFDDKFMCLRVDRIAECFQREDFGHFLLDGLRKQGDGGNINELIVTYHDVYLSKGKSYIQ